MPILHEPKVPAELRDDPFGGMLPPTAWEEYRLDSDYSRSVDPAPRPAPRTITIRPEERDAFWLILGAFALGMLAGGALVLSWLTLSSS